MAGESGRYYSKLAREPTAFFAGLSMAAQGVLFRVVTSPKQKIPGLLASGRAALAEDLGAETPEAIGEVIRALEELVAKDLLVEDRPRRLLWCPWALCADAPANASVVQGWARELATIGECELVRQVADRLVEVVRDGVPATWQIPRARRKDETDDEREKNKNPKVAASILTEQLLRSALPWWRTRGGVDQGGDDRGAHGVPEGGDHRLKTSVSVSVAVSDPVTGSVAVGGVGGDDGSRVTRDDSVQHAKAEANRAAAALSRDSLTERPDAHGEIHARSHGTQAEREGGLRGEVPRDLEPKLALVGEELSPREEQNARRYLEHGQFDRAADYFKAAEETRARRLQAGNGGRP